MKRLVIESKPVARLQPETSDGKLEPKSRGKVRYYIGYCCMYDNSFVLIVCYIIVIQIQLPDFEQLNVNILVLTSV